ncbi:MAG TPA: alpha-hydroxy acid oxidase [Thermoanaerobaculia bacterium]|jgi:4-hydroxymandelate oxidase|nr:alpha-hydroxy acid oxidase [Thermoanaerobaculia bacterium]
MTEILEAPSGAGRDTVDPTSLVNLDDFEAAARACLSPLAYDYYAGGSYDELTLHDNQAAFRRRKLAYRVLRDLSTRTLATTVLGQPVSMPVLLAPTAFHRLADEEGEVATARAAAAQGTVMMLSTLSTCSLEAVCATGAAVWFQLYVYRDRGATRALVERAEAAGCRALVLTVDAQLWGRRERDVRNRFSLPPGIECVNLDGTAMARLPPGVEGSGLSAYVMSLFDPALSWKDLAWLASITRLPVVVKGIVHPDDARLAAEHGAAAVVVSNHGGRQVDTAPATLDALPAVVEAVDGKLEVLLDGGIRRGSDVIKALALGARAVGVGRPVLWGLAIAGQQGVELALQRLRDELDVVMGLCGCASPAEVGRDLIFASSPV